MALVTGASSGIGQAIAIALGREGANVGINFHDDLAGAEDTEREIRIQHRNIIKIKADISKEEEVLKMFDAFYKEFGTIDILINNSGIQIDNSITNMSLADWQRVIDVNLTGHFLCSREAVKKFISNGVSEYKSVAAGKIIFISSVHDKIPWSMHSNYASSKGGINMLMKSLALELAPKKIRVNCISPGAIQTNINVDAWSTEEALRNLLKLIPYSRIGIPDDIAKTAVWLASDDADYVTGTTIYVDGGMTLYPGFAHGG